MKVINVLTALALVCLPTIAVANNLPFVGKRDFHIRHFDGAGGYKQIQISKKGSVRIYEFRKAGPVDYSRYLVYQGQYKTVMNLGDGEYISILNKNQIAYTDKNGNILSDCGGEDEGYCVANLTKSR